MPGDAQRYRVRAVERALNLLGQFSVAEPELSFTELSSRLGLSGSTTYRLLATLEHLGHVQRNEQTGAYRLGFKCLDLGTVFLSQLDLRGTVMPVLEELRQQCRETVHLAILDPSSMEIVYIEKLEGLMPIGMMGSRIGGRAPAYCTALGRCLLGDVDHVEVESFYSVHGLPAQTPATVTDVDQLLGVLNEVRARGYAIDEGEYEVGVKCVAAPIRNHRDTVVGAMSVSGPRDRVDLLVTEHGLIDEVKAAGHQASTRMGYGGRNTDDPQKQEAPWAPTRTLRGEP